MIIDARQLPPNSTIQCDVCIVGSGAAGITLACELRNLGKDVVLLEGGGSKLESSAQDLYRGEVLDPERHGALHLHRQRRFGGTTAVWGGRCAPFDEIDFEVRPWVPYSGWPIGRKDLDPYYVRAHPYFDAGEYSYEAHEALPQPAGEYIPGLRSDEVRTDRVERFSLPTDFGKKFKETLKRAEKVKVYLHANCLKIRTHPKGASVAYLEAGSAPQRRFTVIAQRYVLATGGLEVARLLLVSNDVHPNGIGNDHDLVGRFYMSHMAVVVGPIAFTHPIMWQCEKTKDGIYCLRGIRISEQAQRREQLLNFRGLMVHPPASDPQHGNGILSAMYLLKACFAARIPPEYSKALSAMKPLEHIGAHCSNVVKDVGNLIRFSGMWMRKRVLSKRRLPCVLLESRSNVYWLQIDSEQAPNPDSRVALSEQKDAFGIRRLRVDWRCLEMNVQSVLRCCQIISKALEQSGAGKMLFEPELMANHIRNDTGIGGHNIGTTRMATDPSRGVVDENCRVHGIDNLYIASSSVFPTTGPCYPTLTIGALAIRLADHLKQIPTQEATISELVKSQASD